MLNDNVINSMNLDECRNYIHQARETNLMTYNTNLFKDEIIGLQQNLINSLAHSNDYILKMEAHISKLINLEKELNQKYSEVMKVNAG